MSETTLTVAATYLPIDRRLAMVNNRTIPDTVHGAALFADISGFTPLTIALAQDLGRKRGAEEVLRQINPIYEGLVTELHRFGGSVIGFAGDAITCWLDDDPVMPLAASGEVPSGAQRAVACALAMQAVMARCAIICTPAGQIVNLGLKIAVAGGTTRRFVIGNPDVVINDTLAGKTLERMTTAEKLATTGEIVVGEEILAGWPEPPVVSEWREKEDGTRFAVIDRLAAPVPAAPWPDYDPEQLAEARVQEWLLPAVYESLQVSGALFGDLRPAVPLFVNFSGIDYDADPLAMEKLNAYVCWAQRVIDRHGGSFIQLTIGDKGSFLYAVFGAPRLNEDDANRAVAAALVLQNPPAELQYIGQVQVGITQGQVWTGNCGATKRCCYAVMGNSVNMSARLMAIANRGQVLVMERVARLADEFVFNDLGQIQVKGRQEPLSVSEAHQIRSASTAKRNVVDRPFGREAVIDEVLAYLNQVGQAQGQIISLIGEPGVGKSHVAHFLANEAAQAGFRPAVSDCRTIQASIPYYAWSQLLADLLEIKVPTDQPVDAQAFGARLQARLAAVEPGWLPRLPLLGDIFNIALEETPLTAALNPQSRQQSLFGLVIEILQRLSVEQPLWLLIDDTQWMDSSSVELIEELAPVLADSPVALLLVQRSVAGGEGPLAGLAVHEHHHTILLEGLSETAVAAVAEKELAAPLSSLALTVFHLIAYGNPFFTRELLRLFLTAGYLVESEGPTWELSPSFQDALRLAGYLRTGDDGLWQLTPEVSVKALGLDLPDSVSTVVLAQLDRLPESEKLLLKVASVFGYEFEERYLAAVQSQTGGQHDLLDRQLTHLAEDNFINLANATRYQFQNNTYQEVLYDSLLFAQRRELHRRIARQYEEEFGDVPLAELTLGSPPAVYYPLLAHHWHHAESPERERVYARLAGQQMALKFANQRAENYFSRALALTPESDWAARYRLLVEREKVNNWQAAREAQAEDLAAMAGLVDRLDDPEQQIYVHMRQANYRRMRGYYQEAVDHLQQVLALARRQGLVQQEAAAYREWGRVLVQQGRYREADDLLQKALDLAEAEEAGQMIGHILMDLSSTHYSLGNNDQMEQYARRALAIFEQTEDVHGSIGILINLGLSQADQERIEAAVESNRQALALCNRVGYRWGKTFVLGNLGFIYALVGGYEQSVRYQEEARLLSRELGDREGEAFSLYNLGLVAVRQEQYAQAERYFQQAMTLSEAIDYGLGRALTQAFWARALEGQGQWPQAGALYEQARGLHEAADQTGHMAEAQAGLARVVLAQGDVGAARELALKVWQRLGGEGRTGIYYPGELYLTCYNVFQAAGQTNPADRELAQEVLAAGRAYLQDLADQMNDPELRRAFLENVAAHKQLLHLPFTSAS